ncbi:hypothetical protein [Rubrobacter indicoceani]|uniref:hypothetical protein n=1 Tax=Rubrobacter indicoceani TaxID=2051957 RepID=UPI000E5C4BE2|nr:hypothetical protein [Rubrobacter indicoceani]
MDNREDTKSKSGGHRKGTARVLAAVSFVLIAFGLIVSFTSGGASIVPGFLAIVCGVLAYALGSNRLGPLAIALGVIVAFFGLAASQGLVPGLQATDHSYPENIPEQQSGEGN